MVERLAEMMIEMSGLRPRWFSGKPLDGRRAVNVVQLFERPNPFWSVQSRLLDTNTEEIPSLVLLSTRSGYRLLHSSDESTRVQNDNRKSSPGRMPACFPAKARQGQRWSACSSHHCRHLLYLLRASRAHHEHNSPEPKTGNS